MGFIATLINYVITAIANNYLATKVVLTTLFITVLPIILNNFVASLLEEAMNFISSHLQNYDSSNLILSFTGLSAWFITTMKLDLAFSIIVSAISLRFTLNLIPFVRV